MYQLNYFRKKKTSSTFFTERKLYIKYIKSLVQEF